MNTIDDEKSGRRRREYVEPKLIVYGSIADATGSFISDDEAVENKTHHDRHDQ